MTQQMCLSFFSNIVTRHALSFVMNVNIIAKLSSSWLVQPSSAELRLALSMNISTSTLIRNSSDVA